MNQVSTRPNLNIQIVRHDLCTQLSVNGQSITVFDSHLSCDTNGAIRSEGNLIFLEGISAANNLEIKGRTVIAFQHLETKSGNLELQADHQISILRGCTVKGDLRLKSESNILMGRCSREQTGALTDLFREAVRGNNGQLMGEFLLKVCEYATPESQKTIENNTTKFLLNI